MRKSFYSSARWIFSLLLLGVGYASMACTVFILTDGKQTHFFNNEDYTNPQTRIWFIPKGNGYFGAAYVGYNDGEPQGGVNTEGLVFDWVTVDGDSYEVDPNYIPDNKLKPLEGNTSQWMLEQCKSVDEAIKFYQTHREPAFAKTTLVIADKSGASVIIGSKNGKLYFDTSMESRSFGYGEGTFKKLYKSEIGTDENKGADILRQCVASGEGGTKYSNSYNLNTGEIIFYNFASPAEITRLNLSEELKKGSHFYETSKIAAQTKQALLPLMLNMNRHILFINKPLADQDAMFTARIKNLFSEVTSGKLKYDDLSESLTNDLRKNEPGVKSMLERLGDLNSLSLIYKGKKGEFVDYSYVMKFEHVTILWQFLLNSEDRIQDFNTLSANWIK